jgi:hypothetical protein
MLGYVIMSYRNAQRNTIHNQNVGKVHEDNRFSAIAVTTICREI